MRGIRSASVRILALGLSAGSVIRVAAQDADDGLVAEEVEPGAERIISDGAGHDLDHDALR